MTRSGDDSRLDEAVTRGIISAEQAAAVRALGGSHTLYRETLAVPVTPATVGYVLGAIIVVAAMAWFLADRWEWLGPGGALATSLLYGVVLVVTAHLLRREGFGLASDIAITLSVATVPPAMLALNALTGWYVPLPEYACQRDWSGVWACRGEELLVELATVAAALMAFRWSRFAPLVVPVAVLGVRFVFMGVEAAGIPAVAFRAQGWIWMIIASLMTAAAYRADRVQAGDADIARWLHLLAAGCAIPAVIQLASYQEWYRHLLVPGALVAFSMALLLRRPAWLLFGMGCFTGYVVWLAASVFRDSPAFPIVLAAVGVAVIVATVQLQRHAGPIAARLGVPPATGRPRFPGGVPLLLAPVAVALLMLPGTLREEAERRRESEWRSRIATVRAHREARARADAGLAGSKAVPPGSRVTRPDREGPAPAPVPGNRPLVRP